MKIYVKNRDYGFLTAKPVTVQVFYKGELIHCNHDGYFEDTLGQQIIHSDDSVTEWEEPADICDKCYAYRWRDEEEWHDES